MSRAKPAYFFSDANRDSWQPTMRRLVLDRLETTAASISATGRPAKATVIQEPHGTEGISLLFEVLPESRLLFLLRDGRDVIDSVVDAASALASHGTWPIPAGSSGVEPLDCDRRRSLVADAAYAWLQRTDATRAVVERLPSHQALQVRYEDLRSDTDAELARILRWAGLDLDDERRRDIVERLAFERVPADQTGPGKFSRSASPGQWRVNLTTVEQCEVHSIIGARLEELGYAVP
jgi:hypothetical protein